MAGGVPLPVTPVSSKGFLKGRRLYFALAKVISLFFLWGFSYGLLDVLNKHFQDVLKISKLESTGLQVVYFGGGYLIFSPVAAEVMKRRGYKFTILMGLALYSLGAIFFWPTAHFSSAAHKNASFGGFCVCTLVIAGGLATLETAANSYATVIGDPARASFRLQFCQSWNGVASFIGPLIASKFFFTGANANNLVNVQFVYLAVACAGFVVFVWFLFTKLEQVPQETEEVSAEMPKSPTKEKFPQEVSTEMTKSPTKEKIPKEVSTEMRESSTVEEIPPDGLEEIVDKGPLWKQYNMICAFLAQLCYVGAQVTVASFFVNYATENASFSSAAASNLLSFALMTFTLGRFLATALTIVFHSSFLLMIYASFAIALNVYVIIGHGKGAVVTLICLFALESPMYPMIFTLGTANLGKHTRRGAGILVMGVAGGAFFPPIQGAVADSIGTRTSYIVPLVGFVGVLFYVSAHWLLHGMHILHIKPKADPEAAKADLEASKSDPNPT